MSACESVYVHACVCEMAPGYKEQDHTLEKREKWPQQSEQSCCVGLWEA